MEISHFLAMALADLPASTPQGDELSSDSLANKPAASPVPLLVPSSATISSDLAELIGLWQTMDAKAKADLLAVAREWPALHQEQAENVDA